MLAVLRCADEGVNCSVNCTSSSSLMRVSHETASSSAECSRDKPPFSFVRGQDSTMWDIVWVSPQGHRSVFVSRHFLDHRHEVFKSSQDLHADITLTCNNGHHFGDLNNFANKYTPEAVYIIKRPSQSEVLLYVRSSVSNAYWWWRGLIMLATRATLTCFTYI